MPSLKDSLFLLHHPDKNENSNESTCKFQEINELVKSCVVQDSSLKTRHKVTRLDRLFVHPIWGYSIFLVVFVGLRKLVLKP